MNIERIDNFRKLISELVNENRISRDDTLDLLDEHDNVISSVKVSDIITIGDILIDIPDEVVEIGIRS